MSDVKGFKSNSHILYSCKYHVVFCLKYRRKVLVDGVDKRLKEIIDQVAKEVERWLRNLWIFEFMPV
jgi:REP element-mobilizing transposase RayT